MKQSKWMLLLGAAACSVALSGCGSDGFSLSAGTGHGLTTALNNSGTDTGGGDNSGTDTGGTDTGGSGSQAGLGTGAITVTAGGTTLDAPSLTSGDGQVAGLVQPVLSTANSLVTSGNAALPLQPVADAVTPATSALPISTTVSSTQLTGGSSEQPLGVSVLADQPSSGSIASVGLGSGGKTADVTLLGNGLTSLPGGSNVTDTANTSIGTAAGATTGLLSGSSTLANATVQQNTVINGDNPLIGASIDSATQSQGSLLTVGTQSGSQPLTLKVGDTSLLPATTGQ